MNGWIGVDLDGTLAEYHGWKGETHIGMPIPLMVERISKWREAGYQVKIFTARVSVPEQEAECREAIRKWCLKHLGYELEATCKKDYAMIELYDDRAIQIEQNTGKIVGYSTRGNK